MTNLTSAQPRDFSGSHLDLPRSTHAAAGALWEGSAVQFDGAGRLLNLTGAGTTFAGFADESATELGDRVNVIEEGKVLLTVTKGSNFAGGDVQAAVYATDGDTFTLTSAGGQKIGRIAEIVSGVGSTTAQCWVYIKGVQRTEA